VLLLLVFKLCRTLKVMTTVLYMPNVPQVEHDYESKFLKK